LLWTLFCAIYWGPLFAADPTLPAWALVRRSIMLVWRAPLRTLLTASAVLLTLIIGVISVGGLFLIVPITVALLQAHLFRHLVGER
jgi:uncharacterized membrane protein